VPHRRKHPREQWCAGAAGVGSLGCHLKCTTPQSEPDSLSTLSLRLAAAATHALARTHTHARTRTHTHTHARSHAHTHTDVCVERTHKRTHVSTHARSHARKRLRVRALGRGRACRHVCSIFGVPACYAVVASTSSGSTQSPTSASVKGLMLSNSLVSWSSLVSRICRSDNACAECQSVCFLRPPPGAQIA
jgi:hypothetical protein